MHHLSKTELIKFYHDFAVFCQVGNKKIDIGDSFSVEHPKQQADVIFVVEQVTDNAKVFSELITPLMNVVKTELKDHGIT